MVDANITLILIVDLIVHTRVVVHRPRARWKWIAVEELTRDRVEPPVQNPVACKLRPGEAGTHGCGRGRIVDGNDLAADRLCEIAAPLQKCRDGGSHGAPN